MDEEIKPPLQPEYGWSFYMVECNGNQVSGFRTHWMELQTGDRTVQEDPNPSCCRPTLARSRGDPETRKPQQLIKNMLPSFLILLDTQEALWCVWELFKKSYLLYHLVGLLSLCLICWFVSDNHCEDFFYLSAEFSASFWSISLHAAHMFMPKSIRKCLSLIAYRSLSM